MESLLSVWPWRPKSSTRRPLRRGSPSATYARQRSSAPTPSRTQPPEAYLGRRSQHIVLGRGVLQTSDRVRVLLRQRRILRKNRPLACVHPGKRATSAVSQPSARALRARAHRLAERVGFGRLVLLGGDGGRRRKVALRPARRHAPRDTRAAGARWRAPGPSCPPTATSCLAAGSALWPSRHPDGFPAL
jgi:hypothetical protein